MASNEDFSEAIQEAINALDLVCDSMLAAGALCNDTDEDFNSMFEIAGYAADNASGILRDMREYLKGSLPENDRREYLDSIPEAAKETGRMRSKYEVIAHSNPLLQDDDGTIFVLR